MGWFEKQIYNRREVDDQLLDDSYIRVMGVVMGERNARRMGADWITSKDAIDDILKYYHYKPIEVPNNVKGINERLDYSLRPHGIMRRDIELKKGWYKDSYGPILGFFKEDGRPVALLPRRFSGYYYKDAATGQMCKLNSKTEKLIDSEAICFYRPLPQKELGIRDLLKFMGGCISGNDIAMIIIATLAVSGVGLIIPRLTKALTGPVLNSGSGNALIGIAICIICVSISSQLLSTVSGMLTNRIEIKTSIGVSSSMMMRLMSLPVNFFRKYSPGELKNRAMSVNQLCSILMGIVMKTSLTSITSLLYVTQIFRFAPTLVIPSIVIVLITVGFSIITTVVQVRISRESMDRTAKESGMSYSIISGIQKIKLSGSEKRVFAKWMGKYADEAELTFNAPLFIRINGAITTGISLVATIVLYYFSAASGLNQSSYFAFISAYGSLKGAFTLLASTAQSAAQIRPILEIAEPFLKTVPETQDDKEIVTNIRGGIELEHVSFRYDQDSPYVLKDLSLRIKSGEYVAIVGRTGCGKSTLMRLLLGFEKPEKGTIYYDNKDLESIDVVTLRRKIGSVMQQSGLIQGDIYSNITLTAPGLPLEDAWEAAEIAGIADDIRSMPMGMQTVVSEGEGGVSGGQKQRLMIARAVAPKPKVLMFDEATSALDNKTQKQVSNALDNMGCTRVIIAHRLSTIRHCDRILVLDDGHIIEEGNYDELIEQNGYFAEMVERQRLEVTGDKN